MALLEPISRYFILLETPQITAEIVVIQFRRRLTTLQEGYYSNSVGTQHNPPWLLSAVDLLLKGLSRASPMFFSAVPSCTSNPSSANLYRYDCDAVVAFASDVFRQDVGSLYVRCNRNIHNPCSRIRIDQLVSYYRELCFRFLILNQRFRGLRVGRV